MENIYEDINGPASGETNAYCESNTTAECTPDGTQNDQDFSHYTSLRHENRAEASTVSKQEVEKASAEPCWKRTPPWAWAIIGLSVVLLVSVIGVGVWNGLKTSTESTNRARSQGFSSEVSMSPRTQVIIPITTTLTRETMLRTTTSTTSIPSTPRVYLDCQDAKTQNQASASIEISPDRKAPFLVECNQHTDGGGWTIIQRRASSDISFNQNWTQYKQGFGAIPGNHWLGNEQIHRLTHNRDQSLLVTLQIDNGQVFSAAYNHFSIAGQAELYRLNISHQWQGDDGDALRYNHDVSFSTSDEDNDEWPGGNCGKSLSSGWWYGRKSVVGCGYTRLNARWGSIWWLNMTTPWNYLELNSTLMMVRGKQDVK